MGNLWLPNPLSFSFTAHTTATLYRWRTSISDFTPKATKVRAVENSLKSLEKDIDNTIRLIGAHPEPYMLVGHDYGGAVITRAGNEDNVSRFSLLCRLFAGRSKTIKDNVLAYRDFPSSAMNFIDAGRLYLDQIRQVQGQYCQDVADDKALPVHRCDPETDLRQNPEQPSGEAA